MRRSSFGSLDRQHGGGEVREVWNRRGHSASGPIMGRTASSIGEPIAMRFLIVWRKESDGISRIARASVNTDVTPNPPSSP